MRLREYKCVIAGLITATLLSACHNEPVQPGPPAADLIFVNGGIYTVNPDQPWAESAAIKNGVIVFVGNNVDSGLFQGTQTEVIDLDGRMLLPGFQDAHIHPVEGGIAYTECPLYDLPNQQEIFDAIRRCSEDNPDASYIRGKGWNFGSFENNRLPTREMLDAIDASRPLIFLDSDGHTIWVNSRAMEAYGLDKETPDPEGGHMERDPLTGELRGTFHEHAAMDLIRNKWPAYTDDQMAQGLRFAQNYLSSVGVTAMQDAIVKLGGRDMFRSIGAYAMLEESGELNLRVSVSLFWEGGKGIDQIEEFKAARENFSTTRLRVNTIKLWADGVVEAHTARLLEPYTDRPDSFGLLMIEREEIMQAVPLLEKHGFQLHYHAIGDAAVRYGLDAVEASRKANGVLDLRPHFAHVQFVHPDDIPRFGELNATANFQPLWAYEDEYITALTRPRVGPGRIQWTYPMRGIQDAGGRLAFGSDWPVSSANPLEGIEVAVTRVDPMTQEGKPFLPQFAISLADAIAAYTINSAYVNFLDDRTGTIDVGKYADLVVLDRNLFNIPTSEISEAQVILTLLEGKAVYSTLEN